MTTSATCASSCRCAFENGLLTRLSFRSFRNLDDAWWEPGDGAHVLLGPNGAGKTSLLEALYILATTRSFRTPRIEECRRQGSDAFLLTGRTCGDRRQDLELGWNSDSGRHRRLNGSPASGPEYLEALSVVCWSAEQYRVLDGGPRHRRRLLDQGTVGRRPAMVAVLSSYRRALEHKRQLLKDGASGLGVWNELLARSAAQIIAQRSSFVHDLARSLTGMTVELGLDLPVPELKYEASPPGASTEEEILERLEADRDTERRTGRVGCGPHRDEMEILWDGADISTRASAGEKKLFGLLMTLARAEVLVEGGRFPVMLLDDVDAELDHQRLEAVWSLARHKVVQAIATTSHEAALECLSHARVWRLGSGRIGSAERSGENPPRDL